METGLWVRVYPAEHIEASEWLGGRSAGLSLDQGQGPNAEKRGARRRRVGLCVQSSGIFPGAGMGAQERLMQPTSASCALLKPGRVCSL